MKQILPCLHPNPGWENGDIEEISGSPVSLENQIGGKHCILELYECDEYRLNDEAFVRTTITTAAKEAGATLLNLVTHRFEPQGITGLALLAESHISIHTWPENLYAAVDVFTCGKHTMPEKACQILYNELSAKRFSLKRLLRETPEGLVNTLRQPNSI